MLLVGSLVLAVLNCFSLWLISHHRAKAGWMLTLALQALWTPYDIITGQYGFLLITALTIGIAIKSWKKVHNETKRPYLTVREAAGEEGTYT